MSDLFWTKEVEYIKSQRLARVGTASKDGVPDVAPVGFDFDGKYFYVGGMDLTKTHKYKNTIKNPQVSFVIDDLKSIEPWHPRFIKIFGTADLVTRNGYLGQATYIRITPKRKTSWGRREIGRATTLPSVPLVNRYCERDRRIGSSTN